MLNETCLALTQDGDPRIEIDAPCLANSYGCTPFPDSGLLDFGSSTASVISPQGYAAAEGLLQQLLASGNGTALPQDLLRETRRLRREILNLNALQAPEEPCLILTASGTDALRRAVEISLHDHPRLPVILMVDAAESGSKVPDAMSTPRRLPIVPIMARDPSGALRPRDVVAQEAQEAAVTILAKGHPLLLVVTDVTKTGLIVPELSLLDTLRALDPGRVSVLVDACQYRMTPLTLRSYLSRNCMVALTGSKFAGGPAFSGALLVPAAHPKSPLKSAMAEESLPLGQLLRWEAALEELRRFHRLPEAHVSGFLQEFASVMRQHLEQHPQLEQLPVFPLDRSSLKDRQEWDSCQTIFPFLLYASAGKMRQLLTSEQTLSVFHYLQENPGNGKSFSLRGRLGQPVYCGMRNGRPASALRLCVGARTIMDAYEKGTALVIQNAVALLEHAVHIATRFKE